MARRVTLTDQQLEKMKNAYLVQDKCLQEIATDLGISVPTVSRYLRQAGVTIRSKGRRPNKTVTAVTNPVVEDTTTFPVNESNSNIFRF